MAAKHVTSTIPILFSAVGDPISVGLVTNLARPGGNVTGFSVLVVELNVKRLELLSEMVTNAKVIALLVNPNSLSAERIVREVQVAGNAKGVQIVVLSAGTKTELDTAFSKIAPRNAEALLVGSDPVFNNWREQLVALASHYAIPGMHEWRESVAIGGLASYGPSQSSIAHEVGVYAGRILNGGNRRIFRCSSDQVRVCHQSENR
jgi:putative ABC transport system substrate-binding protein